MKLADLKINEVYVFRKGDDATLYELLGIDGLVVSVKEQGHRYAAPQIVDYSLLRKPTKRQLKNTR